MTVASAPSTNAPDLGQIYRESRKRLVELIRPIAADTGSIPVAACPGWTVHDVVAHLVAVAEDVLAGRLMRPPSDEQTAEQVDRRRERPLPDVLQEWEALAPAFESVIAGAQVWPGALDMLSHEHDVRGAIGHAGARDAEGIRAGAAFLVASLATPVPMVVRMDGIDRPVGEPAEGPALELETDSFEAFRFRLGRRSRSQLAGMRWSADPSPVLDHLCIFGPSVSDIVE